MKNEGTWSAYEAAGYLGCSVGTLRNWTSKRKVPFIKVGGLTRFRKEDLDTWLNERRVQQEDEPPDHLRSQYHRKLDFFKENVLDSYREGNEATPLSKAEVIELLDYTDGLCSELKDL